MEQLYNENVQSKYFSRCFDLAERGGIAVRPNPKVGCVIVHNERIIGEGYHMEYGSPHAEVNAINSVSDADKHLLSSSDIYVSLEPCCHFGLTPPCTDLIIKNEIPKVFIATIDPTDKVHNKGVQRLINSNIAVHVIQRNRAAQQLISEFTANNIYNRPYVQIKFAKSKNNYIGSTDRQVKLSNQATDIYTHKLRSYTDAILIGTNTAVIDNPSLTIRNYPGVQPLRIVLDRQGKLSKALTLLSDELPTLIITETLRTDLPSTKEQIVLPFDNETFIHQLLNLLINRKIYHLTVEGGSKTIRSFVKSNKWDEAVIISTQSIINEGVNAPNIHGKLIDSYTVSGDLIDRIARV